MIGGCAGCHNGVQAAGKSSTHVAASNACEDCHTTAAWAPARFDHAVQADFALQGAHAELACTSCHHPAKPGAERGAAPLDCGSCHEPDDPHRGDLGRDCGRCHTQESWREVSVR